MENRTYDIKPCPFCGGPGKFSEPKECECGYMAWVFVHCSACGAETKRVRFDIYDQCGGVGSRWREKYELEALEYWNERFNGSGDTVTRLREELQIAQYALRAAAEFAYKREVVDTEMESLLVGSGNEFADKEDFIACFLDGLRDGYYSVED